METFVSRQLNFVSLCSQMQHSIASALNCEKVTLYISRHNTFFWFERLQGKVMKKSSTLPTVGILAYMLRNGKMVHCARGRDHPAFDKLIDKESQNASLLGIPLFKGKEVFAGVICRQKTGSPCFTESDVSRASLIMSAAIPALQFAESYHAKITELMHAEKAQDQLGSLIQAAERLCRETNTDNLIGEILDLACSLAEADRGSVFLIDASGTKLISKVARGQERPFLIPIDRGIAGHVALTGEILNIADVYEDERFNSNVDKQTGYKTKSLLTLPVFDHQCHVVAVVQLMNKIGASEFSDFDVKLCEGICVFTGNAIRNSSLIGTSVESSKRVKALLDISLLVVAGCSLFSVLHRIMDIARDLLHADRVHLLPISSDNAVGSSRDFRLANHSEIVKFVATRQVLVNIPDAKEQSRFKLDDEIRSIVVAPIQSTKGVFAVIQMINKDKLFDGGVFSKEDEKLITVLSVFTGIAFEKSFRVENEGSMAAIMLSNLLCAENSKLCVLPEEIGVDCNQFFGHRFNVQKNSRLELFRLVFYVFHDLGISQEFHVTNTRLVRFILSIYDCHTRESWSSVADSLQFVYYLMKGTELADVEKLAIVIATMSFGIIQDENQGKVDEIAEEILYRGRSVALVKECEAILRIIEDDNDGLLQNVTPEKKAEFWNLLISLVLQSGMEEFFGCLYKLRALVEPQVKLNFGAAGHRLLLARAVLFAGRMSSVGRQFLVSRKFARGVNCGENVAKSQIGFILMVVRPLWRVLVLVIPHAKGSLEQLDENLAEWKRISAKGG
jgi:GAF domain-containing protein